MPEESSRKGAIGIDGNARMASKDDKNKALLISLIAVLIIFADQITKLLVARNIAGSKAVIKNIFYLSFVKNTGAAFGVLKGQTMLLIWFAVIVIGVILFVFDKIPKNKIVQMFTALILGGTVSNLIDRLRLQYVIDFIDFKIWPAFNLADTAVTIGCVGLIICLIRK